MKTLVPLFAVVLLLVGCGKKEEPATMPGASTTLPPPATMEAPQHFSATPMPQLAPDTVLIEVNGKKLTADELDREVRVRLMGVTQQIPPDAMAGVRNRTIEQFVIRTLLLQEATNKGFTVTEEDRKLAMDELRQNLPEGTTVEQFFKSSTLGEDRIREQMETQIVINKLLTQVFSNKVDITEKEVDEFIAQNEERLKLPESVRARHILVEIPQGADEATKTEAKKKVETARAKLLEGADFAAVAKEYSSCPSKEKGGDLGTFPRNQMVKPFEDAAFSQKKDEIGPIVETPFGLHVIQVTEKHEAGMIPKDDVKQRLLINKQQEQLSELLQELQTKADIKIHSPVPSAQPAGAQMVPVTAAPPTAAPNTTPSVTPPPPPALPVAEEAAPAVPPPPEK